MFTEKEAKEKQAFDDCGRSGIEVATDPKKETYNRDELLRAVLKYREAGFRRCIASECIGWVWTDDEFERMSRDGKWGHVNYVGRYKQDDVAKPEGDGVVWNLSHPYLIDKSHPSADEGWWSRPNQNRKGMCGRVNMNINVNVEHS